MSPSNLRLFGRRRLRPISLLPRYVFVEFLAVNDYRVGSRDREVAALVLWRETQAGAITARNSPSPGRGAPRATRITVSACAIPPGMARWEE
jgi:hypothetical protein